MRNKSNQVGWIAGIFGGAGGLTAGLWCAWQGFTSQPHNAVDLGIFCGSMGTLLGLMLVGLQAAWRFYQKSLPGRQTAWDGDAN